MSDIHHFLKTVTDKIQEKFPVERAEDGLGFKVCALLPGYIETTHVEEIHGSTPALFLTNVGVGKVEDLNSGQVEINLQMMAYLVIVTDKEIDIAPCVDLSLENRLKTANLDPVKREEKMMLFLSELYPFINSNSWGLNFALPAKDVESADAYGLIKEFQPHTGSWRTGVSALARAKEVYNGHMNSGKMSLYMISWEQNIYLGTDQNHFSLDLLC